jgi:endonuclease/exonuclease/phosphatase family metal-dependent hydrolase
MDRAESLRGTKAMSNNYSGLKRVFREDRPSGKRCAERLLALRQSLQPLRSRKRDSSLLLATWNIRDFDSNKFGWGHRLPETYYYLAEILSCFDLVAVQEVNRNLKGLDRLMEILGREWDYIATDTTVGTSGNSERMAFVFNKEKVFFRNIAGEVVLPEGQLIVSQKKTKKSSQPDVGPVTVEMKQQFARSPFLVAFQAGWFRFSLCTVHIYYGKDSGPELKRRIEEIRKLMKFFGDRQDSDTAAEKDRSGAVENYILLGDFNVVSPEHETMAALKSEGFKVPAAIDGDAVRKKGMHYYDQIAVRVKDRRFKVTAGGIVDMFENVFRDDPGDLALYGTHVPAADPEGMSSTPEQRYRKWRTWQMSDHSPLWVEIETDFSDDYLERIAAAPA